MRFRSHSVLPVLPRRWLQPVISELDGVAALSALVLYRRDQTRHGGSSGKSSVTHGWLLPSNSASAPPPRLRHC